MYRFQRLSKYSIVCGRGQVAQRAAVFTNNSERVCVWPEVCCYLAGEKDGLPFEAFFNFNALLPELRQWTQYGPFRLAAMKRCRGQLYLNRFFLDTPWSS